MFDNKVTEQHQQAIDKIVAKHVNKARRSNHETAFQDAERLGMDEVLKYCLKNDLPTLGNHALAAANKLCDC